MQQERKQASKERLDSVDARCEEKQNFCRRRMKQADGKLGKRAMVIPHEFTLKMNRKDSPTAEQAAGQA